MDTVAVKMAERVFITMGGTETYLQFLQQFPLRRFCAFEVVDDADAFSRLETEYLYPIVDAALEHGHGLLADALLWRASRDHVTALGYCIADVASINQKAVLRMRQSLEARRLAAHPASESGQLLLSADLGPRGDGYQVASEPPGVAAAREYHIQQILALAEAQVDVVCALTMTHVNEAIGIALAAREQGLPCIISATVETDGRLPDQTPLGEFIEQVDQATGGAPSFYMVNCAHPSHLAPALEEAQRLGRSWINRFSGFRANASRKSHAELDESATLDRGDPEELAAELVGLRRQHGLRVLGGCCGTDASHLTALGRALSQERSSE
jgi:S-methylmethionine-dependent homocysteine/selenocysteine methylase